MIDTDNSGTITFDELKEGLKRVGSELMESEIQDLMNAVIYILVSFDDLNYSGSIRLIAGGNYFNDRQI